MFSIKHEEFLESMSNNLKKIKEENYFSDITLISDESDSFHSHKFVLASCSSFFENILKINNQAFPLIFMNGVNSKVLRNILNFVYEGQVEIEKEQLKDFLSTAEKLKIDGLANILNPQEESQKDLLEDIPEEKKNAFDEAETEVENEILEGPQVEMETISELEIKEPKKKGRG